MFCLGLIKHCAIKTYEWYINNPLIFNMDTRCRYVIITTPPPPQGKKNYIHSILGWLALRRREKSLNPDGKRNAVPRSFCHHPSLYTDWYIPSWKDTDRGGGSRDLFRNSIVPGERYAHHQIERKSETLPLTYLLDWGGSSLRSSSVSWNWSRQDEHDLHVLFFPLWRPGCFQSLET
jgi:hypothetical protein